MNCTRCGEGLPEAANFCPKCGQRHEVAGEGESESRSADPSEAPAVFVENGTEAGQAMKGAAPWIVGSILALFGLFVIAIVGFSLSKRPDEATPTELAELNVAAQNLAEAAVEVGAGAGANEMSAETASVTPAAPPEAPAEEEAEQNGGLGLTTAQFDARRSAISYLDTAGFSREGLIQQLSSEYGSGYSRSDAEAAVDTIDVDWKENAARSARQYLDITGFSCSKLIEQLSSEYGSKYTVDEASYGAAAAGAC